MLSSLSLVSFDCSNAFGSSCAFRRSGGARLLREFGNHLCVTDRLNWFVCLLWLRVAYRHGKHLIEFSLGKFGISFHLHATVPPAPSALLSIVRSSFDELLAPSRIPLLASACPGVEKLASVPVEFCRAFFYRSWITSISDDRKVTIARLNARARKAAA
jgi:hypothetical protein